MTNPAGSITRLIDIARRLRSIAEVMKSVELKSQLVDEISTLQELRDSLGNGDTQTIPEVSAAVPDEKNPATGSAGDQGHGRHDSGNHHGRPARLLGDSSMKVLEPTGDTDTYSLHIDEAAPSVPAAQAAGAGPVAKSASVSRPVQPVAPTPEELSHQAELKIAELEPLQQSLIRRMNEILTPEQTRARAIATKEAKDSGKAGRDAQQYVFDALHLTPEQKVQWAAARKDLQAVREQIAQQVALLMTDDQKQRIKQP